ncbi:SDR family oxidoreductase [Spongiibacter nanhainus]|uniref:SDR family oxidoreductase n=1 Tax=Spongiibacter nanhainus TaxID=2794344 RepID=A0A7T4URN4_9GAMM|nr:SDR family oxidoreductase [Spongiibacter nanhainus]QQD18545.1 SDR family oxidoreductase [Spongiibacter nanhainus]
MSQRIFITGGASGLGLALAHRFADSGASVCIGDIHTERGSEAEQALAAKATAKFLTCDVQRESDLQAAADWLLAEWGGVDVVINNAGVASAGAIDEFSMADWQWVMDINLLGVVRGCKVFSALMKNQGSGHIVNIASLAGLIHPPRMGSYCATKAAVVALSESMSLELDGDNIAVSVVCPGFFRTNLSESVRASDSSAQVMTEKLVSKAKVGAEEIADAVYTGIVQRDYYIIPQADARRNWRLKRWLPFKRYRQMMLKSTAGMMRRG